MHICTYIYIIYIECAEPSVCVVYTLQLLPLQLPTVNSRLPSNINIISTAPGAHKDASRIMRNDIIQVYRPLNFCIPSGLICGEIFLWRTPYSRVYIYIYRLQKIVHCVRYWEVKKK